MMRLLFILSALFSLGTLSAEETFSMIKPRAVEENHIGAIINEIEQAGLHIIGIKMVKLDEAKAKAFYQEHEGKPFYPALVEKMSSGPIVVLAIQGDDAVVRLRKVVGATDPQKAEAQTIRARFGKNITENAIHASDSAKSAEREIGFFFSPTEVSSAK